MFHHGFYTIFLLISLGFGLVVFVLGSVIVRLSSQGHKPKAPTLKDFQNKISKVKTQEEAFALVELFYKDFGTISPHSKRLQEWLDTVKSLSGLDFIDTDQAAKIREKLTLTNPSLKDEIAQHVGTALKTKKQ